MATNALVVMDLPDGLDGCWIIVHPEEIVGIHQMGSRPETRLTYANGSSCLVQGTLPEVCRKLYTKRTASKS